MPVTERNEPFSFRRGDEGLVALIAAGYEAGRPIWHLAELGGFPRLDWTLEGFRPEGSGLPLATLAALATGDAYAYEEATNPEHLRSKGRDDNKSRRQLRKLAAAALHDIHGHSELEIAETYAYKVDEYKKVDGGPTVADSGSRAARNAVEEGRRLGELIGAWPWWRTSTDGKMPDRWWEGAVSTELLARWYLAAGGAQRHGPLGRRVEQALGRELL